MLIDGKVVGTFTPSSTSYQSYSTDAFSVAGTGAHTITFQGLDSAGGDNTAFIDTTTLTMLQASTTTLVSNNNPSVPGQSVMFTAKVTSVQGTPTGTVNFFDGTSTTPIGSGTLDSTGVATFSTSTLTVGTHPITAVYSGDKAFATSTSLGSLSQVVTPVVTPTSTTTLVSNNNPSVSGQSVMFTATIAALSPGTGTPTGTVNFLDNNVQIGTGTLSAGVATFSTSTLTVGTHPITAVYSGDPNFTTSTSPVDNQIVNKAGTATGHL